ncbi:MAG TPA: glycosyl hydrolase, partial [Cyclobacteriaceae bacterium]|nr:glycosyl hydrolase [Cyclobacteriaceae bacterium]
MKKVIIIFLLAGSFLNLTAQQLSDKNATKETKRLYANLNHLTQQGIMFGHHEDMAYGIDWNAVEGKSDVKDVCGAYPAVHGWDVGKEGNENNIDNVSFSKTLTWIEEVYKRGGINTVSWHVDNPVTGSNAWDTTKAVSQILPGGKFHEAYLSRLDKAATFLSQCKSGSTYIPIIFRPFHEHNGNWFWWGKGICSEEDYIKLWRFTVDYLKNEKGLHHLIYAFSPDRSRMDINNAKATYLYAYPGDDYVDILGFDDYMDVGITWNKKTQVEQRNDFLQALRAISELSKEKNKIAAITETGLEGVTNPKWFTEVILNPLKESP